MRPSSNQIIMNIRNYTIIFILVLTSITTFSQSFTWVDGEETGYDLNPTMIRYNVSYSVDGTIWFAGLKSKVLTYHDVMGDYFIFRYDEDGNRLNEYIISGAINIYDIENDPQGNLLIGGEFYNMDVEFWDGTILPWTDNDLNGFVASIASDGSLNWVKNLKEFNGTNTRAFDLLASDNQIYLAHGSWPNSYITKISDMGDFQPFITQSNVGIVSGIDSDSQGNIFVTGACSGQQSQFNGVNYPSPFEYNKHLVKYNSDGDPQWIRFSEDVTCVFPKVKVDQDDYVYWAGFLTIPCEIDNIQLEGPTLAYDYFLARLDQDGNAQWAREVPQTMDGDASIGLQESIVILPDNSIVMGGFTRGTLDWGNNVVSSVDQGVSKLMLLRADSDGNAQWIKTGGGEYYTYLHDIDVNDNGDIYVAALANDTAVFDILEIYFETYYYPVIVKMETTITDIETFDSSNADKLSFAPNPVNNILKLQIREEIKESNIYSLNGTKVISSGSEKSVSVDHLLPGLYMVEVTLSNSNILRSKFIKKQ